MGQGRLNLDMEDDPLSSAGLRYLIRTRVETATPGPVATRPFGLRAAVVMPRPQALEVRYCPVRQLAVDERERPLIETLGKEWKSKSSTDGDEGPEENWGWEES